MMLLIIENDKIVSSRDDMNMDCKVTAENDWIKQRILLKQPVAEITLIKCGKKVKVYVGDIIVECKNEENCQNVIAPDPFAVFFSENYRVYRFFFDGIVVFIKNKKYLDEVDFKIISAFVDLLRERGVTISSIHYDPALRAIYMVRVENEGENGVFTLAVNGGLRSIRDYISTKRTPQNLLTAFL